jgi:crotonobetainyl-CoA:carnitine CoA-transferase CaiB-like acyl-CoA transferase
VRLKPASIMSELPLSRFKVIDLTRARAGPTAVRMLADWGADTIKVESAEGDAGLGDNRHGSDFQNRHRNKRSMNIDLKQPEGLEIFYRLVKDADVVVENYRPDVKHRLKIDYETLKAINPRIVYGSVSGFGQEGPYRNRPGVDQIAQGMGGLMSITGLPGQGPVRVGIAIADVSSGVFCAMGILIALLEREVSGVGQWVHTSLLEAQLEMLDFQAVRWTMDKEVPAQAGNNHPTSVPSGVYKTTDGLINIAATSPEIFGRFCAATKADHLLKNPDYASKTLRGKNRDRLDEEVQEVISTKSSVEWIELLNAAGVPCGPIYTMDQVFADPQVKQLGIAQTVNHPQLGPIELLGQGVQMSRTPSSLRTAAPEQGEHTDSILQKLGYDAAAIQRFHAAGVV